MLLLACALVLGADDAVDRIRVALAGNQGGGGTLDLVSMEVSNTATDIVFKLTVNGSFSNVDWGKFMVGIATNNGTGTSTGNGSR